VIYFVKVGKRVKIGYSEDVASRLCQLQTGSSEPLTLLGTVPGNMQLEKAIHVLLSPYRVQGEWFVHSGACRQFINVALAGAAPTLHNLDLLMDFAVGNHRLTAAKKVIADSTSTPLQLRDAHIFLRDVDKRKML